MAADSKAVPNACLETYRDDIAALCRHHRVARLYAFGSVLTDRFSDASDVDLLVDFEKMEPEEYADNFLAFEDSLKSLLRRNVDLVSNKAIRNPVFRANVDRHKHLLYE